jgi:hypothetical protein
MSSVRITTITAALAATVALAAAMPAAVRAQQQMPPNMTGEMTKAGKLVVSNPWARATVGIRRPGAAFMTIRNTGKTADRLVAVSSPVAGRIDFHQTRMTNGVMQMMPVDGITVPAGGSVALQPGGYHLMLMGLKKPLAANQRITLTLSFEKGGKMDVAVPVRALGGNATGGGKGHGMDR